MRSNKNHRRRLCRGALTATSTSTPASGFATAATTHKVDNLDAVAFGKRPQRPLGAAHDLAVEFDGEAFGREFELFDERVERAVVGHVARFSVDFDAQAMFLPSSPLMNDPAQFGVFAFNDRADKNGRASRSEARQQRTHHRDAAVVRQR